MKRSAAVSAAQKLLREEDPVVALAIVVHEGRVLMVRRRQPEGALVWGFPSGEVEAGETAQEAAVREVAEEIGLTVEPELFPLGERHHPATGRHMVYVACRIVEGEPQLVDNEELDDLAWCDMVQVEDRLATLPGGMHPPVRDHLKRVLVRRPADARE